MRGREYCVIDAAGAEWRRVVIADGKIYRVCCGGLVGAALSCKVLGEGQSGICAEFDIVGAAVVSLVGSSAPCGRSGLVLIVDHFVVLLVGIIRNV